MVFTVSGEDAIAYRDVIAVLNGEMVIRVANA